MNTNEWTPSSNTRNEEVVCMLNNMSWTDIFRMSREGIYGSIYELRGKNITFCNEDDSTWQSAIEFPFLENITISNDFCPIFRSNMKKFKSIKHLTIFSSGCPIDYIESNSLREIRFQQSNPLETNKNYLTHVLKHNRHIRKLIYFGGKITNEDIYFMGLNQIETINLADIQLDDASVLNRFISDHNSLQNLLIGDRRSSELQMHLFSNPIPTVWKHLRYLTIHVLDDENVLYDSIKNCAKLEGLSLVFHFCDSSIMNARRILNAIVHAPVLKTISVHLMKRKDAIYRTDFSYTCQALQYLIEYFANRDIRFSIQNQ